MDTALDKLQLGLENVQRVIDKHGDCATARVEDEPDEPIYDLEIAAMYLREAEELMERGHAPYDHKNPSALSADACAKAVGKKATLTLTGTIVDWQVSDEGPFVKLQIDERFGFGDFRLGIDLDALLVEL